MGGVGRAETGGQEMGRGSKSGGDRERQRKVQRKSEPRWYPSIGQRPPQTPLTAPPHKSLLKLFDAFLFQTEPQELQYKPRLRLALEKDFQGAGQQGH